ncbi:MAG: insulinase family protein [Candidatus Portnoybacteria bacterium]|nr:insulinase family protein [Candidatus Portnoybacteria bacterium]
MFKKYTLPNGLRIITAPIEGSKSVTVLVLVGTGSKYETKENNGLSHFLEHMFFKGTKKRPTTLEISSDLDAVGGSYNAFTSKEMTGYWAKVDASHFDLALDWVSDIFLNSKLEEEEIEREKGVILEEVNMYLDTPMTDIWHIWEKLLYGDQPAGWLTLGEREIIKSMRREQFLQYLKNQYVAKNTMVVVAGSEKIIQNSKSKIQNCFKDIRKGSFKNKQKAVEKQKTPQVLIRFKETDQTHLVLGGRSYDIFHRDRFAAALLNTILGGYMSSRLWIEIRERRGLAYYVRSINETYTDTGYLVANAGLDISRIDEAIKVILGEFKKIKEEKVPDKELKKAKDHIRGATLLALESSDEMASYLGMQEVIKKQILTPEQFFSKIEKVTPNDLQRVAKEIFRPEKLNLALIGPFKDKQKFERLIKI